ncbi:cysteine--tRNA ligase [Pontixanthobacter sp. CEM42]|uniref:cysteine--tRNA ligase n=1 Tax=Pontixanthobacter sp. CEM42 TaxID=2792077 RepID=UPI001ADF9463|nr:cysteine--tRNA ligase [Pontixanthobacter sp. CEM42]
MSEVPLKLFNSLTRSLETFEPVHAGEARVYSCGPTVYNYPHIGNMRAYVFADILGRTLSWKGYALKHVINITDVGHLTDDADDGEDKLEKMAAEKAQDIWQIAKHYTEAYWDDIKALNIREPAHWSVATDYIEEMLDFAKSIADKHCYECETGLYFDTTTIDDYGRLARAVTEDGEGRIDTVEGKRNAADFAIWRKTPAGEKRQMEWDSPWGKGAPGWHLECSVMGEKLLGFPFDIHTGGIDHREIHHPNEIAQNQAFCGCGGLSEATNSGARFWMHNNFLVERSGKMSKSSGEFLRLQLLLDKGYHPLAYRMMCLQAHYRSELEFSWDGLNAALTRLKRVVMAVERLADAVASDPSHQKFAPMLEKFDAALADDLNTPIALTALEEALAVKKVDANVKRAVIEKMDAVLGLNLFGLSRTDLRIRPTAAQMSEAEIADAMERRKAARAEKDFGTSDAIRDDLAAKGVELMDGDPLGWDWKLA